MAASAVRLVAVLGVARGMAAVSTVRLAIAVRAPVSGRSGGLDGRRP